MAGEHVSRRRSPHNSLIISVKSTRRAAVSPRRSRPAPGQVCRRYTPTVVRQAIARFTQRRRRARPGPERRLRAAIVRRATPPPRPLGRARNVQTTERVAAPAAAGRVPGATGGVGDDGNDVRLVPGSPVSAKTAALIQIINLLGRAPPGTSNIHRLGRGFDVGCREPLRAPLHTVCRARSSRSSLHPVAYIQ